MSFSTVRDGHQSRPVWTCTPLPGRRYCPYETTFSLIVQRLIIKLAHLKSLQYGPLRHVLSPSACLHTTTHAVYHHDHDHDHDHGNSIVVGLPYSPPLAPTSALHSSSSVG